MEEARATRAPAPWAARPEDSRGRKIPEERHPYRDCFQRDRDRIVHCRAFRRLEYKTQVFPNYEGDHFRTRLTHTIEVAQLARTIAGALDLNWTLAEAIALSHDLGHPPFGHVGEEALDEMLADESGFEHNRQALRIVEELERRYARFSGLNLTYEVREGIVKHSTRYDRFPEDEMEDYRPDEQPLLEAQIIDWADDIAYNVHDVDDGVEAEILAADELARKVPLFGRIYRETGERFPEADDRQRFNETIRALLDRLVTDLIDTTRARIEGAEIDSVEAVRRHPGRLVGHSEEVIGDLETLADYLFTGLYRSPRVVREMDRAREILVELFEAYLGDPRLLPTRHRERFREVGARLAVADYLAGMTDRFAIREHSRVFGTSP